MMMKTFTIVFLYMLALPTQASIEDGPGMATAPTSAEVSASRACFQQLAELNCGHPREDVDRFKICAGIVKKELTESCRKKMERLYGIK
jgi:hypothetical protein